MKKILLPSVLLSGLLFAAMGCSVDVHGSGAGSGRAHACTEVCVDGACTTSCEDGGAEIPCTSDDRDCDGLSDADEALCNTSPDLADTDGDGILDPDEDPDGDGASNAEEIAAGTSPADASDAPGSSDTTGSEDTGTCASDDRDCDGLSDADEALCNTSPDLADTDGDGILDPDEDPDGDGFTNAEEIAAGTSPADGTDAPGASGESGAGADPTTTDSDGDGLFDADEALCNTSPDSPDTDGDGVLDPDEDPDGDGFTNAEEIAWGSDPADGASVPGCAWDGACWDDAKDGCTEGCAHPHGPCGGGGFYGGDTTISCASASGRGLVLPALLLIIGLALPRRRS